MRIALIGNPRSRKNRLDPSGLDRLGARLGPGGEVHAPTSLDALAEVAARLAADPPELLALYGGDGTLHRVFTALIPAFGGRPLPPVVILRGGTMNIVATSIGMRLRPEAALDLARSGGARRVRRWLMRVDGDRYGFLFGNGIIARFLELYYEKPNPSPVDAAWLLARGVGSTLIGGRLSRQLTRRFDGEARVDDVPWPEQTWVGVAAGTVEQIGLGFTPFYLSGREPGRMHVVGVGGSVFDLARELPRVWLGRPLRRPSNRSASAFSLELRGDEPLGYMIDGDFQTGGTVVRVEVGPAVELLVP